MLLDSNIIIHAAQPEHPELRRFIATHAPAVPAISYVEVLGYHGLTEQDRTHFAAFFAAATVPALRFGEEAPRPPILGEQESRFTKAVST